MTKSTYFGEREQKCLIFRIYPEEGFRPTGPTGVLNRFTQLRHLYFTFGEGKIQILFYKESSPGNRPRRHRRHC